MQVKNTEGVKVVTDMHSTPEELERLADALKGKGLRVDLQTPRGKRPYLHVRNPQASMLAENIFSSAGWYWYSWAEKISPVNDVPGAAEQISRVLSAAGVRRDPL